MEQDSELTCDGDDGSLLIVLAAAGHQGEPSAPQVRVAPEWAQDVLRRLDQVGAQNHTFYEQIFSEKPHYRVVAMGVALGFWGSNNRG